MVRQVRPAPSLADLAAPGRVVVLVGAAGSGKTTVRQQLLSAGLDAARVVSLDYLRAQARARDLRAGRQVRAHLRRRERMAHVRAAGAAGVGAVAVLLPSLPVDVLRARVLARPLERHLSEEVLARQAHRRALLDRDLLLAEGFVAVVEPGS